MGRAFAVKTVHKGKRPATENFKDEADGTSGTDIEFVDTDGNTISEIISNIGGHRKVLKLTIGTDWHYINHNFTAQTTATVEFWIRFSEVNESHYVEFRGDATNRLVLIWESDSNLYYYNGAANLIEAYAVDTWYHVKVEWDINDDWHLWIDGVSKDAGVGYGFQGNPANISYVRFSGTEPSIWYVDAFGESWDTDYNIGDNVFWRHLKDSMAQANFEGEATGTNLTSITFIDAITGTDAVIEPSFDEHKKVLHFNGDGDWDIITNDFSSGQANGTVEFWIKIGETNQSHGFGIYDGDYWAAGTVGIHLGWNAPGYLVYFTTGPVSHNIVTYNAATWYHIKIEFECAAGAYKGLAADTFYIWIDNLRYGPYAFENGIDDGDQILFSVENANTDITLDAVGYSWESDYDIADNRTFDYNDTYTKTDITTDIKNVNYENKIYSWRTATLYAKSSYEFTNVFFEIYDVNSKLAMRGEIKNRILEKRIYRYPLRDMNWDDLNKPITNVFTTDKIHDPTDSTSMLKVALPNVSHLDGDLLLATADTEAATYSPTLRFYPTHMFLRDISDLADSVTIIKASGIILLDDDLASGDSLDVDVAVDKRKMSGEPIPTDILETINYFEILGAINPDTGQRFYKLIDNSGDDKKRPWRYVNNEFTNQTDVDAYAAALALRTVPVRIIGFSVQNLGVHDMGTTLNYKYIKGVINIAQANYYIISETINFDRNLATIILSEGLIEESKYSATFERPENYVNSYAGEIYETDINTVYPELVAYGTAVKTNDYIVMDALDESGGCSWSISPYVDESRAMTMILAFRRIDANADDVDGTYYLYYAPLDGTLAIQTIENGTEADLDGCAATKYEKITITIPAADVHADSYYYFRWLLAEAAREVELMKVAVIYYIKRNV